MNYKDYQKSRVLQLMDKIEDLHGQKLMFHELHPAIWNRYINLSESNSSMTYLVETLNKIIDELNNI